MDRGFDTVAVTYTNNDYGQGLADSFAPAFEEMGGTVTLVAAHEDGRADYSAEVGALAAAGGQMCSSWRATSTRAAPASSRPRSIPAPSTPSFCRTAWSAMPSPTPFGTDINGSFGQFPGTDSEGAEIYFGLAEDAGFDGTSAFSAEAYDAAALILMAMQAAGSTSPGDYAGHIMDVANAPGEPILPGELGRALELIAAGTDVDYIGATAVELIGGGESAGLS
jgi:branched-chain amino acid transport system substrate-binding protein